MPPRAVAGGIAVVIDVLRASTTIIAALAHGAARVRPVPTVDLARALAACGGPGSGMLLGGERGGLRIDGFDLGNSPLDYTPARVGGRSIVITTTNGTAALHACTAAAEVLIGAIVNRSAVAARARSLALYRSTPDIHLVCAGTDGAVTEEDLLAAGAILDAAAQHPDGHTDTLDASARAALENFRVTSAASVGDLPRGIAAALTLSRGGSNLIALGMEADLRAASEIDTLAIVPRLNGSTGWLSTDGPNPA